MFWKSWNKKQSFLKILSSIQSCAFKKEVESIVNDKEKFVVQVDFAENFTTQIKNTIQSSYWVSKQFRLFTAWVSESNGCYFYVIVLYYLQHDKYTVMTFIIQLIDHTESNIRCFKNYVFFWWCCICLPFVKSLIWKKNLSWDFFATGHGKGAVDSIRGTLKRDLNTTILSKKIVIKNIDSIYDIASVLPSKINILKCTKKQVLASIHQIDMDTQGISAIPEMQKIYSVNVISPFIIEIFNADIFICDLLLKF